MLSPKTNTILYQQQLGNSFGSLLKLKAPSWDFMSPSNTSQTLLKKKVTLIELQEQITKINSVSKKAFDKVIIPAATKIGIGTVMLLFLSLLLLSNEQLKSGMAAVWWIFTMISACVYLMNSIYKANTIAMDTYENPLSNIGLGEYNPLFEI